MVLVEQLLQQPGDLVVHRGGGHDVYVVVGHLVPHVGLRVDLVDAGGAQLVGGAVAGGGVHTGLKLELAAQVLSKKKLWSMKKKEILADENLLLKIVFTSRNLDFFP